MNIEFRHGPRDGERRFLPIGIAPATMIIEVNGIDYFYRQTPRYTRDGYCIYQCLGVLADIMAA